ncbi:MAG: DEAD/DEAH box helicase, partial [Cyanobacteria bacterium P01_B01_bin.77]
MTSTIQTSPKLAHCSVEQWKRLLQSIESTLLVMPTGSGKTWTARQSLKQWAEQGYLGVYLSPLKALAQEQVNVLRRDFPHLKVGLFTGEVTENPRDVQILVATHEKFDVYLKRPKLYLDWLARIGVVVVDEIHLLADPQRGGRLESLLVRLQEVNPFVQVLGLSATLTNADELSSWLKGRVLRGGTRPVSLETEFLRYKTEEQKIDCLLSRLACGREEGGQTLIFVATRRRAETLETFLSQQGYRVKHHHSGLWPQERLEVEGAFRAGQLEVLVATPTLEMGVNLPARRVILYDTYQFNGEGFEPLSVQSFLQRIGRAGRPGLDTKGEAFVLLPAWADDGPYQRGIPEKVFSRLGRSQILSQFFLDLIEAGLAQSTEDLKWIYQRTLHAHQQSEVDLEGTLALLLDEGFIAKKEDGLRVTYLGRITARLSLSPMDLVLSRKLIDLDAKTPYDLILVVSLWSSLSPRLWCALEDIELMQEALDGMP